MSRYNLYFQVVGYKISLYLITNQTKIFQLHLSTFLLSPPDINLFGQKVKKALSPPSNWGGGGGGHVKAP